MEKNKNEMWAIVELMGHAQTAGIIRTIRKNNNSEVFVIEFMPHLFGKNKLLLCNFIHYSLQKYLEITTSNIKRFS